MLRPVLKNSSMLEPHTHSKKMKMVFHKTTNFWKGNINYVFENN